MKLHPQELLVSIMVALIPFSYFELFGVRVILVSGLAAAIVFLVSIGKALTLDGNFLLFLPCLLIVMIFSAISESPVLLTAFMFSLYLFLFNFVEVSQLKILVKRSLFLFQMGALFMAVGVLFQRILFEYFGIEIGKIDFYGGGRIGFGFIWLDYSFLSLYLITAVPLVFFSWQHMSAKVLLSLVLLAGSVVTTARTGLAALVIAIAFFAVAELFKALASGRIEKRMLFSLSLLGVASSFFVYFYAALSSRRISLSDSGRMEGYYSALHSFIESPSVGVMFDDQYFVETYGVLPHNLFFYILSQGGVVVSVLFFTWFFYVFFLAFRRLRVLRLSIVIGAFGFMFVPSFFSAYFFALLISMAMAERRLDKKGVFIYG